MNIFAYTEFNYESYPGYISVNECGSDVKVTVRSPECNGNRSAEVVIPEEQLLELAVKILERKDKGIAYTVKAMLGNWGSED